MIDYIKGEIIELTPAISVVETNGIGFSINITISTYSELLNNKHCKLYIYEAIREDAHILYGFLSKNERELFLLLISVSGVGANTARMILSSLSAAELQEAIANENFTLLKNIKGIGLKTAQRIVVDLKDKIRKIEGFESTKTLVYNTAQNEALSALTTLGFQQTASQKVLEKIFKENPSTTVEQAIKLALKMF